MATPTPMMLPKGFPIAPQFLVALPVYNEVAYVSTVLDQVLRYATDVLVVDDGSTDGTADVLAKRTDVRVIRHTTNLGYGAALATAFQTTLAGKWAGLVTIDCDGQHQPRLIPDFIAALLDLDRPVDIVSGSRFLLPSPLDTQAPADRRRINQQITADINQRLLLSLSDAFCGFKAYSRRALESLKIRELGYAMPLEVWAQAAAAKLAIAELPVPLIYLDEARSFGGALDDATTRLAYYRSVLDRALATAMAAADRESAPCSGEPIPLRQF
ncbi:MAG: glycosyltransferase family 2 protein [Planctomycetia bacterium]|nr:glycosyltransferase family 2 protein [Planctomycetia bacterium]